MFPIDQTIIDIISEETGLEKSEILLESHFQDDLNLSETEFMELLAKIEEKFSLDIPAEDAEELETVQQLIDLIKDYLNDVS